MGIFEKSKSSATNVGGAAGGRGHVHGGIGGLCNNYLWGGFSIQDAGLSFAEDAGSAYWSATISLLLQRQQDLV